jgi:hypothetical protein
LQEAKFSLSKHGGDPRVVRRLELDDGQFSDLLQVEGNVGGEVHWVENQSRVLFLLLSGFR